jgi:hypothetical protein
MDQPHSNSKIAIIVALIGAIATIAGAIITKNSPSSKSNIDDTILPIIKDNPSQTSQTVTTTEGLKGCYVKTSQMTHLHLKPDPFSATLKALPPHEKYDVYEVEEDRWKGNWFKIKDDDTFGWVMNLECDSVSPDCFD